MRPLGSANLFLDLWEKGRVLGATWLRIPPAA